MKFFQGLYSYEIVLIILGTVLFLLLAVLLAWMIFRNREYRQILPFFLIPLLMIGFPGIKKITYENGKVELEKTTREVKASPADTTARAELARQVLEIRNRAASDPTGLVSVARANLVLGDTIKAEKAVNEALDLDPGMTEANDLAKRISK